MQNPKKLGSIGKQHLLSLPHLPARNTNGRERLIDYLQSHVMNLKKYLTIMWQKVMDGEVIKLIRKII